MADLKSTVWMVSSRTGLTGVKGELTLDRGGRVRPRGRPFRPRDGLRLRVHPQKLGCGPARCSSSTCAGPEAHEARHVLPKDLPNAVKHLNDEELDRLLVVTLAEAKRRGRHTTPTNKRPPTLTRESALSLTRGQLNAVRAAFKAGITPARIARQFGLSQSDVQKALATGASKGGTGD